MQSDQPDEPKEHSKKDRKGKKNKKKRDKGSKGKHKGKGKKGSRKKKHEEGLEDGFLRVSTALPEYLSQEPFQPTVMPETKSTLDTVTPTEVFDKTLIEMPTHEPDSTTEAPTVVSSALPESEVTEEVDKFTCRCCPPQSPPAICSANQSLP